MYFKQREEWETLQHRLTKSSIEELIELILIDMLHDIQPPEHPMVKPMCTLS